MPHSGCYVFGTFEIDVAARTVMKGQTGAYPKRVGGRKVFDLLVVLVTAHPRVVSNEEVYTALWRDDCATKDTLEQRLKDIFSRLCSMLEDDRDSPSLIKRDGGYFYLLQPVTRRTVGGESGSSYDLFIAAPMASLTAASFLEQRKRLIQFRTCIAKELEASHVFCPAIDVRSSSKWDPPDIAVRRSLKAINSSSAFVMLYDADVPSSILVEAGYSLAKRLPSLYFVKFGIRLPFLLEGANQAFDTVKRYVYSDHAELIQLVRKYGADFRDAINQARTGSN